MSESLSWCPPGNHQWGFWKTKHEEENKLFERKKMTNRKWKVWKISFLHKSRRSRSRPDLSNIRPTLRPKTTSWTLPKFFQLNDDLALYYQISKERLAVENWRKGAKIPATGYKEIFIKMNQGKNNFLSFALYKNFQQEALRKKFDSNRKLTIYTTNSEGSPMISTQPTKSKSLCCAKTTTTHQQEEHPHCLPKLH